MWSYRKGKLIDRGKKKDNMKEVLEKEKGNLKEVFRRYADHDVLNKEQLKNAFVHLDAALPYMQAEEALGVANTSNDGFISCNTPEFEKLVDYAYNKGYRYYTW